MDLFGEFMWRVVEIAMWRPGTVLSVMILALSSVVISILVKE